MKIILSKGIFIMAFFLSVYTYGQDNAERNALMALYNATDGPNWSENENWGDTNTPIEEWYGVTVANGHVTELDLDDNNLKDPIPQEIGDLSNLVVLHLSNNLITVLPESIGNLSNLEYLNLYDANLGSLPQSIGSLESLVSLYVPFNNLTSLPESIGNLKNLTGLYLYENKLSSLPESIGGLENLLELYVNDNDLSSLPEGVRTLNKLGVLTLRNNSLPFSDLEPIYEIFNEIEVLTYSPQSNLGGVIEQTVVAGGSVVLNSDIENSVNTTFKWYKAVTVNGRTSFRVMEGETNNTYVIENAGNADQSWYICSATNTVITGFTLLSKSIAVRISNEGVAKNTQAIFPKNLLIPDNQIALTKESSVLMSPNPARIGNTVIIKNIKGELVHVEVINTAFKTFKSETVSLKNNTYTLNTAGLSVGMYIIKITDKETNTISTKNLIIK